MTSRKDAFFTACARAGAEVEAAGAAFRDAYNKASEVGWARRTAGGEIGPRCAADFDAACAHDRAKRVYDSAKSEGRFRAHEALVVPEGGRVEFRSGVTGPGLWDLPPDRRGKVEAAVAWLSARTRAAPEQSVEVNWHVQPEGPGRNVFTRLAPGRTPEIHTSAAAGVDGYIHELGHVLADVGTIQRRLDVFLFRRAGPEPTVYRVYDRTFQPGVGSYEYAVRSESLGTIGGPNGRHAGLVSCPDPAAWLMPDGSVVPGLAVEVLSVGVQTLFRDPLGFAERDPEYCGFVVEILDGVCR